ncbi:MAG: MarR family transcriptional regulator [Acidipropionibacterium sp.]|nr:MarR family transcriptional regulator [Acidipropionibacterium sp.]
MNADPADPPTTTRVILALRRLNSAFAASNRAVGASLGIKESDLAVLDCLNQDGPQTPTELARRTHVHVATMTGILTRLERDGWIERRRAETDRRSVQIHATGVERLTDAFAQVNSQLPRLLEGWAPEQIEMLIGFLTEAGEEATAFAERIGRGAVARRQGRDA